MQVGVEGRWEKGTTDGAREPSAVTPTRPTESLCSVRVACDQRGLPSIRKHSRNRTFPRPGNHSDCTSNHTHIIAVDDRGHAQRAPVMGVHTLLT